MAQGFLNKLASDVFADSAGLHPIDHVDFVAVKVMEEIGIDIGQNEPKMLIPEMNNRFDYIITKGCIDGCPITQREKTIEWSIGDPKGKSIQKYREIRDLIKNHIEQLIKEVIE
jgi:arsenate reductase